jgi:hypothetical protein
MPCKIVGLTQVHVITKHKNHEMERQTYDEEGWSLQLGTSHFERRILEAKKPWRIDLTILKTNRIKVLISRVYASSVNSRSFSHCPASCFASSNVEST